MKYLFVFSVFVVFITGHKIESIGPDDNKSFVCAENGAFEDPDDRSKFYYCALIGPEYLAALVSCSLGYTFNAKSRQCALEISNQPRDASASPVVVETTTLLTTITSTTQPGGVETTATVTELKTSSAPPTTGTLATATTVLYITNTPTEGVDVGSTTQSSSESPAKTTASEIGSSATSTPGNETTTSSPSFKCIRNGMFPDPTENNNFYLCIFDGFGYISLLMQCYPGLIFLPDLYRCGLPDTPISPFPVECNSVGYHASSKDCRSYYYCNWNFGEGYLVIEMTCPAGTNFFPEMEVCVSEDIFECKAGDDNKDEEVSNTADTPELTTTVVDLTTPLIQK